MYSKLFSASVFGIDAFIVEIETHLDNAVPAFAIVGLPDSTIKESRERVTAAIKNSNFIFPTKKITVNLAPADIAKVGSAFDLPIALGVLTAIGFIPGEACADIIALGELSLEGGLRPIHGTLSIALKAKEKGYKKILVPIHNAEEGALVDGVEVIPIETLRQAVEYINEQITIPPCTVNVDEIFNKNLYASALDISDVKGQENVKRAIEIAAAGGHNILFVGPPGSGKTMLAKRLPSILPPLTLSESLETTKIHSIAGMLSKEVSLVTERPFRSPHHTISDAALVGGGISQIRPGEISIARLGVLFLDELPEFARNVLEVLRQPLEDKRIAISRTKLAVEYPANFMLACSMNPCPCGNYGNPVKDCSCSPTQIQRYLSKISGPLLDRIDIHVEVPSVKYDDLSATRKSENSATVRERVIKARRIQSDRFAGSGFNPTGLSAANTVFKNSDMTTKDIRTHCQLDEASQSLLQKAMQKMGLSARAYDRILKVGRTIADLAASADIKVEHISEAIQYRSLDRDYWK